MRILLVGLLALSSSLSGAAINQPMIYDSVVVYAISPNYEAPIQIDRTMLPEHYGKKITLGPLLAYRFSRLIAIWQGQSPGATDGKLRAPHVLIVPSLTSGEEFEVAVDLHSSATELGGKMLPDGRVRREVISYIRGVVGGL